MSNIEIPGFYPKTREMGKLETLAISAASPSLAVIFTNPFDTIKVRLQLQNKSNRIYKNSFDALIKIYSSEGFLALQKGLYPAILREGSKNLFRIGLYDDIVNLLHNSSKGRAPAWKRAFAGSICGVMGAISCNPFELVKTRLQSSSTSKISVGHQHNYTGVWHALTSIYKEDGFKGLYRGSVLSMSRSILGSGSNLATYSLLKEYLILNQGWSDGVLLDMSSGLASGAVSCLFMNPVDVIRTRFYNQTYINGKGADYSSGIDAAFKVFKKEGPFAFYKGLTTHFLRIGPHFCLTFLFLGLFRRSIMENYHDLDLKDSFNLFDQNNDGVLQSHEISSLLREMIPRNLNTTEEEYESLIGKYTTRLLQKADKNYDTVIDIQEYKEIESEIKNILRERRTASAYFH